MISFRYFYLSLLLLLYHPLSLSDTTQICTTGNVSIDSINQNCINDNCSSSGIKIICNNELCQWCDASNHCNNILYNGTTNVTGGTISCDNGNCRYSIQSVSGNSTNSSSGSFSCLRATIATNQAPIADFLVSEYFGQAPLTVVLDATMAYDPDGTIESYQWAVNGTVVETYYLTYVILQEEGDYVVSLIVTDNEGLSTTKTINVSVSPASANKLPIADFSTYPNKGRIPLTVNFNGHFSKAFNASIVRYEWSINGEHFTGEKISYIFEKAGIYPIKLVITDSNGETASRTYEITATQNESLVDLSYGLVAYYPFNGNANDESGNGNHGTVQGASLIVDRFGNANSAYHFDGIDDQINVTKSHFAQNKNLTVSLWLKPNIDNTNFYFGMNSDFALWNQGIEGGISISTPENFVSHATGKLTAFGEWNHIVGTYDGKYIKNYVNGQLTDQIQHEGRLGLSNRPLDFGYFYNTKNNEHEYWLGILDDVRIYNRVITNAEIQVLFNEQANTITTEPDCPSPFVPSLHAQLYPECVETIEDTNISPKPIIPQDIYQLEDNILITMPELPAGQSQYLAIAFPDGKSYSIQNLNHFTPFNTNALIKWQGNNKVLDISATPDLPKGRYIVYSLRVPIGIDPLQRPDLAVLESSTFQIGNAVDDGIPDFNGIAFLTATDVDKISLTWLPASDDKTSDANMRYELHISTQADFEPSQSTLHAVITGDYQYQVQNGLVADTTYYLLIVAIDEDGNRSIERDYGQITTFKKPVIVNPDINFYTSDELELDELTQEDTVYRFFVYNRAKRPAAGDAMFIKINENEGHLRKVTSVKETPEGLEINTTDIALSEILEQATISTSFAFRKDKKISERYCLTGNVKSDGSAQVDISSSFGNITVGNGNVEVSNPFGSVAIGNGQIKVSNPDGSITVGDGKIEVSDSTSSSSINTNALETINSADDNTLNQVVGGNKDALQEAIDEKDKKEAAKNEGGTKTELNAEANVSACIDVFFEPLFDFKLSWEKENEFSRPVLTEGYAIVSGKLVSTLSVLISGKSTLKAEQDVVSRSIPNFFMLGPVPVLILTELSLKAKADVTVSAALKSALASTISGSTRVGSQFNAQTKTWNAVSPNTKFDFRMEQANAIPEVETGVSGTVSLVPELSMRLYSIVGPKVSISPYAQADLVASSAPPLVKIGKPPAHITKLDVKGGIKGNAAISFGILLEELASIGDTEVFDVSETILSLPQLSVNANTSSVEVGESAEIQGEAVGGKNNTFSDASIEWNVAPDTASISGGRTGSFVANEEDNYTVFFSGAGELTSGIRQYAWTDVSTTEEDDPTFPDYFIRTEAHASNEPHGIENRCVTENNPPSIEGLEEGWNYQRNADGKKHGVQIYVRDGKISSAEVYRHGVKHGPSGSWGSDGEPSGFYEYVNGKLNGVHIFISSGGSLDITNYVDGVKNGYSGGWNNDDCTPKQGHGYYVNGKRNGVWTYLYSTGSYSKTTYVNGIKEGAYTRWGRDDEKDEWGEYVNDKKHGVWTYVYSTVYSTGSYSTTTYVNGIKEGAYTQWGRDDEKDEWGEYVNDKKHGIWTYSCLIEGTYTITFNNGKSVSSTKCPSSSD